MMMSCGRACWCEIETEVTISDMKLNTINFIKQHFGCYRINGSNRVLSSIATMSIVSFDELHMLHENAEDYFTIKPTENGKDVLLVLHNDVKQFVEKELGLLL